MRFPRGFLVIPFGVVFLMMLCGSVSLAELPQGGSMSKMPEPTVVKGPLDPEGFVDYEAALNERLAKGIRPETNANVLLWKALGPKPQNTQLPLDYFKRLGIEVPKPSANDFIGYEAWLKRESLSTTKPDPGETLQQTSMRPWVEKDAPRVARWLKANESALTIVHEATLRKEYFNPVVSRTDDGRRGPLVAALLPNLQSGRDILRALTSRAMLRVATGDTAGAWQDLLTSHRLARLAGRGSVIIDGLVAVAIDAVTCEAELAYLERANLTSTQIRQHLADLQALPPLGSMADKVDLGERHMYLDSLQSVRRRGLSEIAQLLDGKEIRLANGFERKALELMDWEPALRDGNRYFDRVVAAMRLKSRRDRAREMESIAKDLESIQKAIHMDLHDPILSIKRFLGTEPRAKVTGQKVGELVLCILAPSAHMALDTEDRATQRTRNVRLAFALAAYQKDHGRYPTNLNELAPKYLPEIPLDLFSDRAIIYRPEKTGYLLYSVGVNGKDDGGKSGEGDLEHDDMSVRVPHPEKAK